MDMENFRRFGEISGIHGAPYIIVQPKEVVLRAEGSRRILDVHIMENDPIAFNREGRRVFEKESTDKEWLAEQVERFEEGGAHSVALTSERSRIYWSVGGLMHVDRNGDAALLLRDAGAPVSPGRFCACTGLSESRDEMLNPMRVMVKEGIEKIVYARDDVLLVPKIMGLEFGFACDALGMVFDAAKRMGGNYPAYELVDAEIITDKDTLVRVFCGREKVSEARASIVINPETGAIDLVGILKLDLEFGKVSAFDTEMDGKRRLDREVHIIPGGRLAKAREGEMMESRFFKGGKIAGDARSQPLFLSSARGPIKLLKETGK